MRPTVKSPSYSTSSCSSCPAVTSWSSRSSRGWRSLSAWVMVVSIHRETRSCNGGEVQEFVVILGSAVANKRLLHLLMIRVGMFLHRYAGHMLVLLTCCRGPVKSGTRSLEIDRSDESCTYALMRAGSRSEQSRRGSLETSILGHG